MKVQVEISNETLQTVMNGKRVEGSLRLQLSSVGTHQEIGFNAYRRLSRVKPRDRLIKKLEHGWVKESPQRIKVHESIPKDIGTLRVCKVLEREISEASEALMVLDIIDRV